MPAPTIDGKEVAYVRYSIPYTSWSADAMLSIDNPIETIISGFLADGIKVKAENIEGLPENDDNIDLSNLKITPEQTTFINIPSGEVELKPTFINILDDESSYQDGMVITNGTPSSYENYILLNYRQFSPNDEVRIRGIDFTQNHGQAHMRAYKTGNYGGEKQPGDYCGAFNIKNAIAGKEEHEGYSYSYEFRYKWELDTYTLTVFFDAKNSETFLKFIEYGFAGKYAPGYNADNVIMTINQEITYEEVYGDTDMTLDDEVKVKAENLLLTSPNGTRYTLTVSDDGTLSCVEFTGD
jgi:hypothetical protein